MELVNDLMRQHREADAEKLNKWSDHDPGMDSMEERILEEREEAERMNQLNQRLSDPLGLLGNE